MKKYSGLALIALIYCIALLFAVIVYVNLPFTNIILKLLIADIAATLVIFIASTAFKNSSIYDPYWSVAPLIMIIPLINAINGVTLLLLIALYTWGIRLTLNWIKTFKGLDKQDWRYDYYKNKSKKYWPIVNLFGIHLMPTIVVFMAMIPAFLLALNATSITLLTFIAFIVTISAVVLQSVADNQMHHHLETNNKTVLDEGLWHFSRHPNYFAEIVFWFGLYLMMLSNYFELVAVFGALLNLTMFITISIPLMEKRQLKRRPTYKRYQRETSMLMPLPKKDTLKQEA